MKKKGKTAPREDMRKGKARVSTAEKRLLAALADPMEYLPAFIRIRNKEKQIVPLRPNQPQRRLYEVIEQEQAAGRPVRIIILKARQMGFSTFTEALFFYWNVTRRNVHTIIVAHRDDATRNLLRMNNLFFNKLPAAIKPMRAASNARELIFANPSRDPKEKAASPGLDGYIRCMTAKEGIGRSDTTDNLHCSELAFWSGNVQEILQGLVQSVPNKAETCVIIESTARGYNYFRKLWYDAVNGENGYVPVFFAWFDNPEYAMEPEPGAEWTAEEQELQQRHGLTAQQLAWRRWCIKANCAGDLETFRQEYPSTPDEAFLLSGSPFFDQLLLDALIADREKEQAEEPPRQGSFGYEYDGLHLTGIRWQEDAGGFIRIYRPPEAGRRYTIGGDTAGEGSDWFAAQVIDSVTKEKMATYHCRHDETLFTRQIFCLGAYYNDACLAIECNFSTYPQRELERLGYSRFYVRERMDTYTHKTVQSFGFRTDGSTRPVILARLHEFMDKHEGRPDLERDIDTLREELTFAYNEKRRPEAIEGEHDDLVMAQAIALFASDQDMLSAPKAEDGPRRQRVQWRDDMWEDYYNATPEQQRYLLELWGRPEDL